MRSLCEPCAKTRRAGYGISRYCRYGTLVGLDVTTGTVGAPKNNNCAYSFGGQNQSLCYCKSLTHIADK